MFEWNNVSNLEGAGLRIELNAKYSGSIASDVTDQFRAGDRVYFTGSAPFGAYKMQNSAPTESAYLETVELISHTTWFSWSPRIGLPVETAFISRMPWTMFNGGGNYPGTELDPMDFTRLNMLLDVQSFGGNFQIDLEDSVIGTRWYLDATKEIDDPTNVRVLSKWGEILSHIDDTRPDLNVFIYNVPMLQHNQNKPYLDALKGDFTEYDKLLAFYRSAMSTFGDLEWICVPLYWNRILERDGISNTVRGFAMMAHDLGCQFIPYISCYDHTTPGGLPFDLLPIEKFREILTACMLHADGVNFFSSEGAAPGPTNVNDPWAQMLLRAMNGAGEFQGIL